MTYNKTCIICLNKFTTNRSTQTTCSKKCSKKNKQIKSNILKKNKKTIYNKFCQQCQNTFNTTSTIKTTCTKICSNKFKTIKYYKIHDRKNNTYNLICKKCKKQFIHFDKEKKYCSEKCRKLGYSEKMKKFLSIPDCLKSADRKLDKNIGYIRVYCPMHREANTRGYVYEHRAIAELIIGRDLLDNEIVHHKNGIRWDNRPENLEVMNKHDHGKLNGQRQEDINFNHLPNINDITEELKPLLEIILQKQLK